MKVHFKFIGIPTYNRFDSNLNRRTYALPTASIRMINKISGNSSVPVLNASLPSIKVGNAFLVG